MSRIRMLALAALLACGPTSSAPSDRPASSTGDGSADVSTMNTPASAGTTTGSSGTTSADSSDATAAATSGGAIDPDTTSGGQTSTSVSGTTASDVECLGDGWEQGCPPVDCAMNSCGSLFSPYDGQGVRRAACGPGGCCEPGFACFRPFDWGGCVPSSWGCEGHTDDCGGAYCVPEELGPPPIDCSPLADEGSCLAAGCTFLVAPFFYGFGDDTCECGEPTPLCVWFPEAPTSTEKPTPYYPQGPYDLRLLPMEWDPPPFGWKQCEGDPDAPPGCACADECMP